MGQGRCEMERKGDEMGGGVGAGWELRYGVGGGCGGGGSG